MRMRAAVVQSGGISVVTGWLMRLLCNNQPVLQFDNHPDVEFIGRDTIQTLHDILKVGPGGEAGRDRSTRNPVSGRLTCTFDAQIQDAYDYDFQAFFDLLQRTGQTYCISAVHVLFHAPWVGVIVCVPGEEMNIMALEDEDLDDAVPKVDDRSIRHQTKLPQC